MQFWIVFVFGYVCIGCEFGVVGGFFQCQWVFEEIVDEYDGVFVDLY